MTNDVELSLAEFVEMRSPQALAELNSISSTEQYPFARSLQDFEDGALRKPSELPFANPKAAEAALRKIELKRLVGTCL